MSDFLKELQNDSLTEKKIVERMQQYEEWLKEAIDEHAEKVTEWIKIGIRRSAQAGKFKQEGDKKVIEGMTTISYYDNKCVDNTPESTITQKYNQYLNDWRNAHIWERDPSYKGSGRCRTNDNCNVNE